MLAGVHYLYDLFNPAETVVSDFVREICIKNAKDNLSNFSLGANTKIKETLGLVLI